MEEHILVSVVTVCYNEMATISSTIESVLNQDFASYEYIIIDGGSIDDTYSIIESYDESFKKKNINYIHLSEKDSGIYNAMNKALKYCNGLWINYMNAGDGFCDSSVLSRVFVMNEYEACACIYGNTWNCYNHTKYWRSAKKIDSITYDHPFVHQASFVRTDVMKAHYFNEKYKIYADWELFLRLYFEGERFVKIDVDIANYDLTGISQQNGRLSKAEKREISRMIPWNKRFSLKKLPLIIIHFLCRNRIIKKVYTVVRKTFSPKRAERS